MPKRNPSKPEPVHWGPDGSPPLATAYARRAPSNRKGKEHWSWVLHYKDPHGKQETQSLGRHPRALVWSEISQVMQSINPAVVEQEEHAIRTLGALLRAYYAHQESRQGSTAALAERTILCYQGSAKRVVHFADGVLLCDLNEATLLQIRDTLLRKRRDDPYRGYAPRTVKADLKFVRQAIIWGRSMGIEIPDISMRRISQITGKKALQAVNNNHTPSEEDVAALFKQMRRSATKLAMYIMWQTGCRVGECSLLRWENITQSEQSAWVFFPDGKTGPRRTPISTEAFHTIQTFRPANATDDQRLFRNPRQTAQNTGAAISEACKISGRNITPFTAHGLRRLFTNRCSRAGVDLAIYADISGHSIETALKYYRKVNDDDRIAALQRLENSTSGSLIQWLRQNSISEAEAMRVLQAWAGERSELVGQRQPDTNPVPRLQTGATANDLHKVFDDDPTTATAPPPRVVH